MSSTIFGVFIIESNKLVDEVNKSREGKILTEILNLIGIPNDYRYIRTKKEFDVMMKQFSESKMRYLHIACHGNKNHLGLTLDRITFEELGCKYADILEGKRLFFSACSVGTEKLADNTIGKAGCRSVIAPSEEICFDDAAIFWASFYHMIFNKVYYELDKTSIRNSEIEEVINKLCALYKFKLNCYFSNKSANKYRSLEYC